MEPDPRLAALRDGFAHALGDEALGLYVLPEASMFLGVTRSRVAGPAEVALRQAHRALFPEWLQGSYAPAADLSSPMSLGRSWLRMSPGSRELLASSADNTAYRRWQHRHTSTTLLGPAASDLICDIDVHGLRAEAIGLARFRAEEIEEHPALLDDAQFRASLVTDLCSILHTAVTGAVLTGKPALTWAYDEVPGRERMVISGLTDGRPPAAEPVRSFAWEVHRLVGAAALHHRED